MGNSMIICEFAMNVWNGLGDLWRRSLSNRYIIAMYEFDKQTKWELISWNVAVSDVTAVALRIASTLLSSRLKPKSGWLLFLTIAGWICRRFYWQQIPWWVAWRRTTTGETGANNPQGVAEPSRYLLVIRCNQMKWRHQVNWRISQFWSDNWQTS